MINLSIVVPAYAAEKSILEAMVRLLNEVDVCDFEYEVIVVVDGKVDNTETLIRGLNSPKIVIVSYEKNMGKGFALRKGFDVASGAIIGFIDADLDIHPSAVIRAVEMLDENNHLAGVVGSKFHPKSTVFYPRSRVIQSKVYKSMVRMLFGLTLNDTQTGLKFFRREPLLSIYKNCSRNGFAFDLELLVEFKNLGFMIAECPIELDFQFDSTVSASNAIKVVSDTLGVWRRNKLPRKMP
jgi:glycosyltransferase involved in cell wall biosynthesis